MSIHCHKCNAEMQTLPATVYCPVCDKRPVKQGEAGDWLAQHSTSFNEAEPSFSAEKHDIECDDISKESNGETPQL